MPRVARDTELRYQGPRTKPGQSGGSLRHHPQRRKFPGPCPARAGTTSTFCELSVALLHWPPSG